jgi:hypothetical protein
VGEKLPHHNFRIMRLPLITLGKTVGENLPMCGWVVIYPEEGKTRKRGSEGARERGSEFKAVMSG